MDDNTAWIITMGIIMGALVSLFVVHTISLHNLECQVQLDALHASCADTFVKIAGLNATEVFQSYEYCARLMNSSDLFAIVKACEGYSDE